MRKGYRRNLGLTVEKMILRVISFDMVIEMYVQMQLFFDDVSDIVC